jgi:Ser/Thr protein kinase RdoA (MazF antagonist)
MTPPQPSPFVPQPSSRDALAAIAGRFRLPGAVRSVEPLGSGNVNATYLVTADGEQGAVRFVLQRINSHVFQRPDLVMRNIQALGDHLAQRPERLAPGPDGRRWELPRLVPARNGAQAWVEEDGACWRTLTFLENARSLDVIDDPATAREVGWGLGRFHHLIHDLPAEQLADTLEGFHVTPGYLRAFHQVHALSRVPHTPELKRALAFVAQRDGICSVLEDARAAGRLRERPIHGDPKVNNVMLDAASGRAIGLVDLDTVKPGLIHYDIGDCLRSGCNRLGEETTNLEAVAFDLDLCAAILEGYLAAAGSMLEPVELEHIYDAARLISFELGLRFLSDHLAGNVYFRAEDPEHNLRRALVQFLLTESIEAQETAIRSLVERLA